MPQTFGTQIPVTLPELGDQANIVTAFQNFYYGEGVSETITAANLALEESVAGYIQKLFLEKAPLVSPSFTTPSLGVATATSINGTSIPSSKTLVYTTSGLSETAVGTMLSSSSIDVLKIKPGTDGDVLKIEGGVATWVDFTQAGTIENALYSANLAGDSNNNAMFYQSGTKTTSQISSNVGTTRKFMSQVNGEAPAWAGITSLTEFSLRDTSAAYDLTIAAVSSTALTGAKSLTLDVVNGNRTVKLSGNLTIAGNLTTSGAYPVTLTATASTSLTLPTSGTVAVVDGNLGTFTGTQYTGSVIGNTKGNILADSTDNGKVTFTNTVSGTFTPVGKIFVQSSQPVNAAVGDIWMW